jgi:hypothetical protein
MQAKHFFPHLTQRNALEAYIFQMMGATIPGSLNHDIIADL